MMQHDWNIQARSNSCQLTGKPFQEGEYFYTLLLHDPEHHFVRQDLSEEAWRSRQQELRNAPEGESPLVFSFWRSLYELPPVEEETLPCSDAEGMLRHLLQKRPDSSASPSSEERPLKGEILPEVLSEVPVMKKEPEKTEKTEEPEETEESREVEDAQEQQQQKTAYILALLLERKKLLKPLPSEKKGILLYEHTKTGELFVITDPHLSFTDLEATQREVMEILKKLS